MKNKSIVLRVLELVKERRSLLDDYEKVKPDNIQRLDEIQKELLKSALVACISCISLMMSEWTKEEKELIDRLSRPPKCMHNPFKTIETENHFQCGECGFICRKITTIFL